MSNLKEMNSSVGIKDQVMSGEEGSVVLINVFTVDPSEEDALVQAWKHDADFMKAQPGYISTQLHKGIAGSATYINYAIWETVESFQKAFTSPEFQKSISAYPASAAISPHLFKKLAVSVHCTD